MCSSYLCLIIFALLEILFVWDIFVLPYITLLTSFLKRERFYSAAYFWYISPTTSIRARLFLFLGSLLDWMMEPNYGIMICLNGINYHRWKGKMKDLLFVQGLHLPIFAAQKSESKSDEDWAFEHKMVCGFYLTMGGWQYFESYC